MKTLHVARVTTLALICALCALCGGPALGEVNSTVDCVSHNGNGSTKTFAVPFGVFSPSEIRVVLRAADGTETVQTINSHFTATDNDSDGDWWDGTPGGSITFTTAPPLGSQVWIARQPALTQTSDLDGSTYVRLSAIEDAVDQIVTQIQYLRGLAHRALQVPETERQVATTLLPSSVARANGYLAFDADGDVEVKAGTLDPDAIAVRPFWADVLGQYTLADSLTAMGGAAALRPALSLGVINVKDAPYLAVGDGSTDDSAAFAAARDAAGPGGTVVIPTGTYLFGSAVNPGNNMTWRGMGPGTILKCSATNTDHAIFKSTNGIRYTVFENFTLRSNDATAVGIECEGNTYLDTNTFRRLDFYPEFSVGIRGMFAMTRVEQCRFGYLGSMPTTDWVCVVDQSTSSAQSLTTIFDACWFYNANSTAAVVLGKGNTRVFKNCIWEGCNSPAIWATGAWGIYLDNCNFELMDPNASSDPNVNKNALFYLNYDSETGQPSHVFAEGCYFTNNAGYRGGQKWDALAYTRGSGASGLFLINSRGALDTSYLCLDSLGAYDTDQVWYQGLFLAKNNVFTGYAGQATSSYSRGDVRLHAIDPAIVFQPRSAGDTRWWMGITENANGVDDDPFEIGPGTTKGSSPAVSISSARRLTANAGMAVKNGSTSAGYVDFYEDSDHGTNSIRLQPGGAIGGDRTLDLLTTGFVKVVCRTISLDDDASTDDYQFDDDAANMTEQVIAMTNLVPAYAEILSVQLRCFQTVTGSTSMSIDVGTTSGGNELLTAANVNTINSKSSTAAGGGPLAAAGSSALSLYVNATPGANWNTLNEGRWALMVTYIDYGEVYTQKNP